MKKLLFAILISLFLPLSTFAEEGQTFGTVFDAAVYESPDASKPVITTIPVGDDVNVIALDKQNYWARVMLSDGTIGYVDLGAIDYPGGQTVTVTEVFDAKEMASSTQTKESVMNVLTAITVILIFLAGLIHMIFITKNKDNEKRIFVGSTPRVVLFAVMMFLVVFLSNDTAGWKIIQSIAAIVISAFSYYAYMRPASKIIVDGVPSKNMFQILAGMWFDLENRKTDQARIDLLNQNINRLKNDRLNASEKERENIDNRISEMQKDINEEQFRLGETFSLAIFSIIMGVLFVWLTPFYAIVQYLKNYPFYLKKREKYQNEAFGK